jgi:hypothetical protein
MIDPSPEQIAAETRALLAELVNFEPWEEWRSSPSAKQQYKCWFCDAIADICFDNLNGPHEPDCVMRRAEALLRLPRVPLAEEGWRDIATAPKDGNYMLLVSPAHGRVIGAFAVGDVWHLVGVGAISSKSERPTHWMPLPQPPLAEEGATRPRRSIGEKVDAFYESAKRLDRLSRVGTQADGNVSSPPHQADGD